MLNLQERAHELLNERNQLVTRVTEINGALKELDRMANTEADDDPSTETSPT